MGVKQMISQTLDNKNPESFTFQQLPFRFDFPFRNSFHLKKKYTFSALWFLENFN